MSHVRQQIRDALATILTGQGVWGSNVFKMRSYPLSEGRRAAVCIYTTRAEYQPSVISGMRAGQTYDVTLSAAIELFISSNSETVFDEVDTQSAIIEDAIGAKPDLDGLVKDVSIVGVETDVEADGSVAIGTVSIELAITYRVSPTDAETAIQ
jgi:hypothetical protein